MTHNKLKALHKRYAMLLIILCIGLFATTTKAQQPVKAMPVKAQVAESQQQSIPEVQKQIDELAAKEANGVITKEESIKMQDLKVLIKKLMFADGTYKVEAAPATHNPLKPSKPTLSDVRTESSTPIE